MVSTDNKFKHLLGKFVSIMITGKDKYKETYMGVIKEAKDNYLLLSPNNPSPKYPIDQIYIRVDVIESLWVFKEQGEKSI